MNNDVRSFLNKIVRGELEETSARKMASELLDKYTLLALWKDTNLDHVENDYEIIRIVYNEDFQNTELLVVRKLDIHKAKKFIQECYNEFYPEEDDETSLDLQEKYEYLHAYIESCLDNHSDIPHSWIMYDEMNMDTY
jgi:hypothetical protein